MNITVDLLRKYNVQGPRYTSYPPAPSWNTSIGPKEYEAAIESGQNEKNPAPLSLYFHLPFCEKLCYFCGCTTLITGKNRSFTAPYLTSIMKEVDWLASRVNKSRPVVQLHLGGGTPTYLTPSELEKLLARVHKGFSFDANAEVGAEIDPRVTSDDHLKVLREMGFNRLSMGVQDFDETVQKSINRVQPYAETRALVDAARKRGFASINMDLIYGLPHQTRTSFDTTIDQILSIGPDRLAVYSYAHVPWLKKHQELLENALPNEQQKFELFLLAMKKFTAAGFDYIGMDHFAKPGDELATARKNRTLWRNFQGYTTKAGTDLFGLGMSAIGNVHGTFVQNEKDIKAYQDKIDRGGPATVRGFTLSKDDKIRSRLIQNLMCHAEVIKSEIEKEFSINFDAYFADALATLKPLEADGLVQINKERLTPTETGRVFLRNLAMPFDAYLPKEGDKKVFSRTV